MLPLFRHPPRLEPSQLLAVAGVFIISVVCHPVCAGTNGRLIKVECDSDKNMVVMSVKGEVGEIKSRLMSKPNRLVLDFNSNGKGVLPGKIKSTQLGIDEIRVGGDHSKTKIVLDFGKKPMPEHTIERQGNQARLIFHKSGTATKSETKALPQDASNETVKKAGTSSLAEWLVGGTDEQKPEEKAKTEMGNGPWAEPAPAQSGGSKTSDPKDEVASVTDQVLAQAGSSSQGTEQFRPPASVPMRRIEPADKPETSRTRSSGGSTPPQMRTPSGGGAVREIRPPVTPPEPDPRLLVQELTEMKFIQVGHNSRLYICGGDHLDYRLERVSQTKLKLDLINAEIPKFYQKPLRTDLFSTSVQMIIPGSQTIFIQLKEPVPYKVEKKKGVLMVDFAPPRFELTPEMEAAGKALGPSRPRSGRDRRSGAVSSTTDAEGQTGQPECELSVECLKKRIEEKGAERDKRRKYALSPSSDILDKTITMDFQDIRLRNAFRLLSEQASLNITLDPDVDGKDAKEGKEARTTLRLQNVPIKDVINTILMTNELDSIMVGDVLRIGTKKKIKEFLEENTKIIESLDKRIAADSYRIRELEARERREQNPASEDMATTSREIGDAGCMRVLGEEICFYYETVKLTYADPQNVVKTLDCMFNEKRCYEEGGSILKAAEQERKKGLEKETTRLAEQGFTPDSPGGIDRLRAASQQLLDRQRTDLDIARGESGQESLRQAVQPDTTLKDPRTKAIVANSLVSAIVEYRQIFIKDTLDRIAQMKRVIKGLDVPAAQVNIESRIVVGSRDWGRTLGVMWGGRNNQYGGINGSQGYWGLTGNQGRATYSQPNQPDAGGSQLSVPPGGIGPANNATGRAVQNQSPYNSMQAPGAYNTASSNSLYPLNNNIPSMYAVNLPAPFFNYIPGLGGLLTDPVGLGIQFGLLGGQYLTELDARIQLGEAQRLAKTISRPKVQVLDREEAFIQRGLEIPYFSTSQNQGTQVQFKDAVLELKVTPTIFSDCKVQMKIEVKDDFPDTAFPGGVAIAKRRAKTMMTVKDAETCVIGGIIRDDQENRRSGWPGLMNLPLVGYLFGNKKSEKGTDELFIFITPTIVKRPPAAS